jgi:hypothetical protein
MERAAAQSTADPRGLLVRRAGLWLYVVTASLVAAGVLLQAFSIAAYIRGAGSDARDLHSNTGYAIHLVEIVVFLAAVVGYWGAWRRVGLALLLPVIGTIQVVLIGDTGTTGGWINGLHGLFALLVFLLALVLAQEGVRTLRAAPS